MIFESRNTLRRKLAQSVVVTDALTGETLGYAADLSEAGMQLQARAPMVEDAIYQLRFQLEGALPSPRLIEAGAHVVWLGPNTLQGQRKGGLRFLAISEQDRDLLHRWTEASRAARPN